MKKIKKYLESIGDKMQLKIERMNHTGEGIAIEEGKVYFVKKTIPGDIIEVQKKDIIEHKNYNEVITYKIVKNSEKRVKIECPYYEKCGGCQIMGLSYSNQLLYKKEKVEDIFKKVLKEDRNLTIEGTTQYHYRNKVTFQVKDGKIGFFSENTKDFIEINQCLLIPNELNQLLPLLKKLDLSKIEKIILKQMNQQIMIQLIGNIKQEELLNLAFPKITSIYMNDICIKGKKHLESTISKYKYDVSPNSFFQINHDGTEILYDTIKKYLGKDNNEVLDLYCGTGTIGIYISENCKNITGIEINNSSIEDAKNNMKLNNIKNLTIIKGDVGKLLKNNKQYDTIIVDPPREGLDKKVRETLLKINSKKIIYISCNPITLARDINDMKENYKIEKVTLVDMFPNTYHVETVMILERRNS